MRIAFLNRVTRPWDGRTLETEPLGGTQTAIVYLAEALAARQHAVTVYCQTEGAVHQGVQYRPIARMPEAKDDPFDVLVVVAEEEALRLTLPARRVVWWAHNDYAMYRHGELPDVKAKTLNLLAMKADQLVTVSQWHADWLSRLFGWPRERFWAAKNGFDPALFQGRPDRLNRLVYTSVPDRGLDLLLTAWPRLQRRFPDWELAVWSGFQTWGKTGGFEQALLDRLRDLATTDGVLWLDPLPKAALARELLASRIFVYPSHPAPRTLFFAETSCTAAIEAMAAGLPVVATPHGALPETIGAGGIVTEDWEAALGDLMTDHDRWAVLSEEARARAHQQYAWPDLARDWEQLFQEVVARPLARSSTPVAVSPFPSPKVSIVMPTYNRARNLKWALQSLLDQTEPAFEVMIADDGSTDETADVVAQFRGRINLRYLFQAHDGFRAGQARNLGLEQARGKFVLFLDSDLVVPPTFVAAHLAALQEDRVVVNSYVWRMNEDVPELDGRFDGFRARHGDLLKPDSRERFQAFDRAEPLDETYFLDSNALSMPTALARELEGFDPVFVGWGHEDTELGYRLSARGFRLRLIREDSFHLWHPVSPTKDKERACNWQRMTAKHGITRWYQPLETLTVSVPVLIAEQPGRARLALRVGDPVPSLGAWRRIQIESGIVTKLMR